MCGIAGQIDWTGYLDESEVAGMVRRIGHRGPDDSGIWRSADARCVLGHARLSIVDLSAAGHQPMVDSRTGSAIVFNGEIYNFLELRQQCEKAGEHFVSRTDTEVILALYRQYGIECLRFLRGMFAFAIWDTKQRHLFLARDRVGKKPLNYSMSVGHLIFASEIDALARHTAIETDIDNDALELYLQLQYIPAPWSIYGSVRKLPPAHYALFDEHGLVIRKYWDVDYRTKIKVSEPEAVDGLEEKLKDAVRLRMIADVPVGALLSGGVDSSLVVALMAGLKHEPVNTYSIGFNEEAYNELPYAGMVAERYQTEHLTQNLEASVEPLLDILVRHYGEPFADSSAIPSFHVCRAARRHVKVVMNGDGGDELLGGYQRYWLPRPSIELSRILARWRDPSGLAALVPGLDKATGIVGRARRKWLLRIAYPELQSMTMYSGFWNDEERAALLGKSTRLVHQWQAQWLTNVRGVADNAIDRMLWIDNRTYLPGDLLVKMDIASMHCGLEARSPLLDHEVIEYCASLPVSLKVRHGTGKYLLKKLAERYLPREVIYRPKMGFGIPLAEWLRGRLRTITEQVLFDARSMEGLEQTVIRAMLAEFYRGQVDHSSRIWAILMFGLWRSYCVGSAGRRPE